MGQPAARLTDMHTCPMWNGDTPHVGGPILPDCKPTVLIGGLPAARVGDPAYCNGPTDVIAQGSRTVLIGGRMAARLGDATAHGGVIVAGDATVLIGGLAGGGIGATGATAPVVATPKYSPTKSGWHHYTAGPNLVCSAAENCSRQEIVDQLSRFAVPGQDPSSPISNGKISMVYALGTDNKIAVGHVITTVSDDGLSITNTTLRDHIFYDGQIVRTASQAPDGSWYVTTEGTGNNIHFGMAEVNEESGPYIFDDVDDAMRQNILSHHGF